MFFRYWREWGFWRWLWETRVPTFVKTLIILVVLSGIAAGGVWGAMLVTDAKKSATTEGVITRVTVQHYVTVREKGKLVRKLVRVVRTVKRVEPRTDFLTRTIADRQLVRIPVVRRVVHLQTVTVGGKRKVITHVDVVTTTQTQTVTNERTVVSSVPVTSTVVGPGQTLVDRQTVTNHDTVTNNVTNVVTSTVVSTVVSISTVVNTVTDTVTGPTVTETVTVTEPAP
jgi:hypothetical protein